MKTQPLGTNAHPNRADLLLLAAWLAGCVGVGHGLDALAGLRQADQQQADKKLIERNCGTSLEVAAAANRVNVERLVVVPVVVVPGRSTAIDTHTPGCGLEQAGLLGLLNLTDGERPARQDVPEQAMGVVAGPAARRGANLAPAIGGLTDAASAVSAENAVLITQELHSATRLLRAVPIELGVQALTRNAGEPFNGDRASCRDVAPTLPVGQRLLGDSKCPL